MPPPLTLIEVSPRDGLQNEPITLSAEDRSHFIDLLSACGFPVIEVGSFVSPRWIPQMARTDEVFSRIKKHPKCRYVALVPNEHGMQAARIAGFKAVAVFMAASETFNQKNSNCSIEESFTRFQPIFEQAKAEGIWVRGYISTVITCPYEGVMAPERVATLAKRLYTVGCDEISLGDTIGSGTPETIRAMVQAVIQDVPVEKLAIHCHDTYGQALENTEAAVDLGISRIDASVSGIGGCPYASATLGKRAPGNVATEKVIDYFTALGYRFDIDKEALLRAKTFIQERLGLA